MDVASAQQLSPADVAALLQREGSGLSVSDYDEDSQPPGTRERRTELLADTLATCQSLWHKGSQDLDLVAENLGNGSRDSECAVTSYGEAIADQHD